MTKILADALVPIFAGLLLGYIAGFSASMDNKDVRTLITFVMSFAIPSSMFLSIVRTSRVALREQVPTALVLLISYAALYAGTYCWARYGANLHASDSSVVALTIAFPNSAAVGFPLLASVFGSRSAIAVATSLAIGSITVSPITLALLEAKPDGSGAGGSLNRFANSMVHSFKRPIVWAPLLGLLVSLAGLNLPSFVHRSLAVMGSAADGSALVLTGLVASAQKFEIGANTLIAVFLKNAIQPAVALGFAMLIHLSIKCVTLR